MSRTRKLTITIKCEALNYADNSEIAEFISDALECWGGQRSPEDPLFSSLSVNSVFISKVEYTNPDPKKI